MSNFKSMTNTKFYVYSNVAEDSAKLLNSFHKGEELILSKIKEIEHMFI